MFSFFKRADKEPESASMRSQIHAQARKPNKNFALDPLPLPQVTEGNEDSDWAMWEDSVLEQDSQMHSQFNSQFHDTVPSELPIEQHAEIEPNADPFAKVSRHAP